MLLVLQDTLELNSEDKELVAMTMKKEERNTMGQE
jgi:hypothetical protein